MADETPAWLGAVPARFQEALRACAQGRLSAPMAAMRVLVEAADGAEAVRCLRQATEAADGEGSRDAHRRLSRTLRIIEARPEAWSTLKAALGEVDHHDGARHDLGPEHWAAAFDRAARVSPEASVALYSLGDPGLLDAATADIVERLRAWGLLGRDRAVLDIGCGIGRFERALSPHVGHIHGIDVSSKMIALARERCAGLANVTLDRSDGRGLRAFADRSFDLVLAADVFPYLVQAEGNLALRHVLDAARVLRPGGALVVLNWSYRGDIEADRADVAACAEQAGFQVLRRGTREFATWDGMTFLLRQAARPHDRDA